MAKKLDLAAVKMTDPAAAFREMAERIEKNDPAEFAGAILLVPPDGKPIEILLVDKSRDEAFFWATASSRIEIATAEFGQRQRGGQDPFGRR